MHKFKIYAKSNTFLNAFKVLYIFFRIVKNFSNLKDTSKHTQFYYYYYSSTIWWFIWMKYKNDRKLWKLCQLKIWILQMFLHFVVFFSSNFFLKLRHKIHLCLQYGFSIFIHFSMDIINSHVCLSRNILCSVFQILCYLPY